MTGGPVQRSELLELHRQYADAARDVMEKKNQDYGRSGDIFANFRSFGTYGILVRMSDKIARLASFEEKGHFAVSDEGLEDTLLDIINYAILYGAMRRGYNSPGNSSNGPGEKNGPETLSKGAVVLARQRPKGLGGKMERGRYMPCIHDPFGNFEHCFDCEPSTTLGSIRDATGTSD